MAQYQVSSNQNIFDIALHLYGSIEGIYDLLMSNPWLTMKSEIPKGTILEYHDYFVISPGIVSEINNQQLIPANSERKVYFKKTDAPCVIQLIVPTEAIKIAFVWSGEGDVIIDWGDNSPLETIQLKSTVEEYLHYFDNNVDNRIVKVYGDFSLRVWDTSGNEGTLYVIRPIIVDEYISQIGKVNFEGLPLLKDTYLLDLSNRTISDLSPIYDMSLQILDLRNVIFKYPSVLENYLTNLVTNYGNRRACTVYLSETPTQTGMNAINTIINEVAWNDPNKWVFNINGNIYTKQ